VNSKTSSRSTAPATCAAASRPRQAVSRSTTT
jgi:hypothetical protein